MANEIKCFKIEGERAVNDGDVEWHDDVAIATVMIKLFRVHDDYGEVMTIHLCNGWWV